MNDPAPAPDAASDAGPDTASDTAGPGINRRALLGGTAAGAASLALAACSSPDGGRSASAAGDRTSPAAPAAAPTPERDLPGNADWRIRSVGSQHAIEGYADKVSILPGDGVSLHVSTSSATFKVSAYRMGWYGGAQARLVWQSETQTGHMQKPARLDAATRTIRTDWPASLTVPTAGWPDGAYLFRLDADSGHQRYVPLIVRSASAQGKMLFMHAVATWQAYNLWGGYSLYQGPNGAYDTRSLITTFDRPYDDNGAEKFMVYERAAVALAEKMNLPLAYTTGVDVHRDPSILSGAAAVISLGHDEYWTPEQRASVTKARDAGTNVAFLGANTCFRRIRFQDTGLGANRDVICYKTDYRADPMYPHDPVAVSTDFRTDPSPNPESSMTGVYYEGYPTDAPYVVHNADHWLFAGAGVKAGDSFAHLIGVEYDRVTPGAPTPRPIEIIAHSPLVCNGTKSHADSAYYTAPGGAGVFASGTMRWVEGLLAGTPDGGADNGLDARAGAFVNQVTENLFKAFAAGPAGKSQPAPRDNIRAIYG
jgi:hypothetical protein